MVSVFKKISVSTEITSSLNSSLMIQDGDRHLIGADYSPARAFRISSL